MTNVQSITPPQKAVSLNGRVTLVSLAIFILFALGSAVVNKRNFDAVFAEGARDRITLVSQTINFSFETMIDRNDLSALQRLVENVGSNPEVRRLTIVDRNLTILADKLMSSDRTAKQQQILAQEKELITKALQGKRQILEEKDADGTDILTVALPLRGGRYFPEFHSDIVGVICLSYDLGPFRAAARRNTITAIVSQCITFLAVIVALNLFARRFVLKPIRELAQVAHEFAQGDLTARVTAPSRTEIGELGAAFNDMAGRLQEVLRHREIDAAALTAANSELVSQVVLLETANKELEKFSYTISHDLRAPLRAIAGFSRILLEEYAAHLPEEGQRYLRLSWENAHRMDQLIHDLLTFTRLGRRPLQKKSIVPAALVRTVLADLQAETAGRQIEVVLGELGACQADPALLKQVLTNLLSNAFKFTRAVPAARIEIGCRNGEPPGQNTYFVKDNGAGFDMQYAHKLFGVFQRLHRAEDYEGTGAGLAIVQRIIHRHGGRVWAEGAVNQGATFYFTLSQGVDS